MISECPLFLLEPQPTSLCIKGRKFKFSRIALASPFILHRSSCAPVGMRLLYLTISLLLLLMNANNCLARKKYRKTNAPGKPISRIPKTSTPAKPGELSFKGGRHPIQLNQTEEYEVYAANYTMFPDALFYPRRSTDGDIAEFLVACMNTTLEADVNSMRLSQVRSNGEVYIGVLTHVIEFLCLENFYKEPDSAHLLSGGLWEVLMALVFSLVLKQLG